MSTATHDRIVESIYDSALNPQNWQATITLFNDAFNSVAAGFFIQTTTHQIQGGYMVGLDMDELEFYSEHVADKNPWFTVPGLMRPGRILSDRSLEELYNDKNAFTKTEMYQDWYRRLELRHTMGGNLADINGNLLNFTFIRPASGGYYSEREIQAYAPLCRHLLRAVELNDRLDGFRQQDSFARETVLNQLRIGIILLDGTGKVSFINDYAQTLLDDDKSLSIHASRLTSSQRANQGLIRQAIESAYKYKKSSTFSLYRQNGSPLAIHVVPSKEYRNFLGLSCLQAAVMIVDPDDRNIGNSEYFAKRWCLTPLESQFCMHMLRSLTVPQIADALRLTQNTARWYLKQILQKLGVNRQTELVSKLLNDLPTHCFVSDWTITRP